MKSENEYSGHHRRRGDYVIEGNQTVEKNLYVDGNASVDGKVDIGGSVSVGKNMKVEGFLDAPNIRGCSKGLFLTREDLIAKYPRPHIGWWAVVCSTTDSTSVEGVLFLTQKDEYERPYWDNTGQTCSLDGLISQFDGIDKAIDEINSRLDDLDANLNSTCDYLTSLEKVIDGIGEGLDALKSVAVQEVTATATAPLRLTATTTNIVQDDGDGDEVVGQSVSITGEVAEASSLTAGVMSITDKVRLDAYTGGIACFTTIIEDATPEIQSGVATTYVGVYYFAEVNKFLCLASGSSRIAYAEWEASGAYLASSAYMTDGVPSNKLFIGGDGKAYVYDSHLQTLVLLGDTSAYDTERIMLSFAYNSLASGRVNNGTERFNGVYDSSATTCVFYEDAADEYDGIVWLCDKKMFVAYKAAAVSGSGCTEAVWFFFYHWATDYLYMEAVAEEAGLWKDKVYIFGGAVYVWTNCDKNLVRVSGSGDIEELTEEEILEDLADFEFVDPSGFTGITTIDVAAKYPLVAEVRQENSDVTVDLSLQEASEEEIDNIFGIETDDDN